MVGDGSWEAAEGGRGEPSLNAERRWEPSLNAERRWEPGPYSREKPCFRMVIHSRFP